MVLSADIKSECCNCFPTRYHYSWLLTLKKQHHWLFCFNTGNNLKLEKRKGKSFLMRTFLLLQKTCLDFYGLQNESKYWTKAHNSTLVNFQLSCIWIKVIIKLLSLLLTQQKQGTNLQYFPLKHLYSLFTSAFLCNELNKIPKMHIKMQLFKKRN